MVCMTPQIHPEEIVLLNGIVLWRVVVGGSESTVCASDDTSCQAKYVPQWKRSLPSGCATTCGVSENTSGTNGNVVCEAGSDSQQCEATTKPAAKVCPATAACGQWSRSLPNGCATSCGVAEGTSGTNGAVVCEAGSDSQQCDATTKPAAKVCPATEACSTDPKSDPTTPTTITPPASGEIVYLQKLSFSGVSAAQIDQQGKKDIESSIASSLDVKPENVKIVNIRDVSDRRLRRLLIDSGVEIVYKVTISGGNKENAPLAKELEIKMNRIAAGEAPTILAVVKNKVAEVTGVDLSEIAVTATAPTKTVQEKGSDEKVCCEALTLGCVACSNGMTSGEYCVANPKSEYCGDASDASDAWPWWLSALVAVLILGVVVAAVAVAIKMRRNKKKAQQSSDVEVELPAIAIGTPTMMRTNPMPR